jgi:hypothetical protein
MSFLSAISITNGANSRRELARTPSAQAGRIGSKMFQFTPTPVIQIPCAFP